MALVFRQAIGTIGVWFIVKLNSRDREIEDSFLIGSRLPERIEPPALKICNLSAKNPSILGPRRGEKGYNELQRCNTGVDRSGRRELMECTYASAIFPRHSEFASLCFDLIVRKGETIKPCPAIKNNKISFKGLCLMLKLKQSLIRYRLQYPFRSSGTLVLFLLSLMVGLGSALGVWLFKRLIDLFHMLFFDDLAGALAPLGAWTPIVATVLGGLIVGWIMYRLWAKNAITGWRGFMESVAMGGGRLRYRRMPIKAVTAGMSIGAGASVGPEDPSVQIGANIGSFLGQVMKLSEERVRALVAAGAAGGIAAAFNAPIAAVFFAVESCWGN
jgi:hypothetical protein